jgi:hypothetical protein
MAHNSQRSLLDELVNDLSAKRLKIPQARPYLDRRTQVSQTPRLPIDRTSLEFRTRTCARTIPRAHSVSRLLL